MVRRFIMLLSEGLLEIIKPVDLHWLFCEMKCNNKVFPLEYSVAWSTFQLRRKLCNCLLLLVSVFKCTFKSFLCKIYRLLPKTRKTSTGLISLDPLKKVCVSNIFEDVICNSCDTWHAVCFSLFTVASIHSIRKVRNMIEGGLSTRLKQVKKQKWVDK